MRSAAECVQFERESFGALHQMLSGVDESEREDVWSEITEQLAQFEGPDGFEGPCEMLVVTGTLVASRDASPGSAEPGDPRAQLGELLGHAYGRGSAAGVA